MRWLPRGYGGERRPPEEIKRDGWREQGLLAVSVDDDRLTWPSGSLSASSARRRGRTAVASAALLGRHAVIEALKLRRSTRPFFPSVREPQVLSDLLWAENGPEHRANSAQFVASQEISDGRRVRDAVAIEPVSAPNSLLTGKLTGNFAESGLARRFSRLLRQQIQCFAEKFPTQRNREFLEP